MVLQRTPGSEPEERFVNFVYQPITGPDGKTTSGIFVDGSDITDRVRAEQRQAALIELGDRLRELTNPTDIAGATAEILGRTLGGIRAGYATVDDDGEYSRCRAGLDERRTRSASRACIGCPDTGAGLPAGPAAR